MPVLRGMHGALERLFGRRSQHIPDAAGEKDNISLSQAA
jgi:hypothetical protein